LNGPEEPMPELPEPAPLPPPEDELPPPPSDIAEETKKFPALKVKKTKPLATVRRAFVIFEKDFRTMAKHGLLGAVILFIVLAVIFSITSYAMEVALTVEFGEGDGEDGPPSGGYPGATESVPPVADAGTNRTIDAGTATFLDASGSTDNAEIVYYVWNFHDGMREIDLYGETLQYRFDAVGTYEVHLTVVDSSWNFAEDNVTINVVPSDPADTESPMANAGMEINVQVYDTVQFDGSNSTDNVGVANWTWYFEDVLPRFMFGPTPSYTFDNAGNFNLQLFVRDASGNVNQAGTNVYVNPLDDNWNTPEARMNIPRQVNVGTTVELDASETQVENGPATFTWYIEHNNSMLTLTGETASFVPEQWGPYEVKLAVRSPSGMVGTTEDGFLAFPEGVDVNQIAWSSTPGGLDLPFNLLSYAYAIALVASVVYIGGLFAKGIAHEINKGTVRVLMSGPISVTTVIFSKILYPLILGPIFILPLVMIGLSRFGNPAGDVMLIALVAYAMSAVTMVAGAYGACILYLGVKKMLLRPSVVSRLLLYFSLLATFTVMHTGSFLVDSWFGTESWGQLAEDLDWVTILSPFHQGGIILSQAILGTAENPDIWVFALPVAMIVLGALASRKLYTDIFARE